MAWADIGRIELPAAPAAVPAVSAPAALPAEGNSGVPQVTTSTHSQDFILRSLGELRLVNRRGGITVHGWPLDKIRIRSKKTIRGSSTEVIQKYQNSVQLKYEEEKGSLHILEAVYGSGLSLSEKIQERKLQAVQMDMEAWVPIKMAVQIWGMDQNIRILNRKGSVRVRSQKGDITVDQVDASEIELTCPNCSFRLKQVSGKLRILGGAEPILLEKTSGSSLYVESSRGRISMEHFKYNTMGMVSESGAIWVRSGEGQLEFRTRFGEAKISDLSGSLSGQTISGIITADVSHWSTREKSLIESELGAIEIQMPADFSAEVELRSDRGKMYSEFPIVEASGNVQFQKGPLNTHRVQGKVGVGGEYLRIFSKNGDVRLHQKKGQRP